MSFNSNQNIHKHALMRRILSGFKKNPRIAILMSGKGSNTKNILEHRHWYPNLDFVAITTDNSESNAEKLGREYGVKAIVCTGSVGTKELRKIFFATLTRELEQMNIEYVIYAGFMKIAPREFVLRFPGINMHPSDLTRIDNEGTPLYRGMGALPDAINAGESYVASTLYVVDDTIDAGFPLAVSRHIPVVKQGRVNIVHLHEKLKHEGEHHLFPIMLSLLAKGKINENELPLHAENDDLDLKMV